eukprot:2159465-Pyramimonas_sp.AAC.1
MAAGTGYRAGERARASSALATVDNAPVYALRNATLAGSGEWNPRVWDMSEVYNPMYQTASHLKFLGALICHILFLVLMMLPGAQMKTALAELDARRAHGREGALSGVKERNILRNLWRRQQVSTLLDADFDEQVRWQGLLTAVKPLMSPISKLNKQVE